MKIGVYIVDTVAMGANSAVLLLGCLDPCLGRYWRIEVHCYSVAHQQELFSYHND